jgi:hypothetical protein
MQEPAPADTSDLTDIRLTDAASVLAAVPHLIGHYPVNSVVVIGLHGEAPYRIGMTARADIPQACHNDLLAKHLLRGFAQQNTTYAILVVIGGGREPEGGDLPYRALVDSFTTQSAEAGVPVVRALWAPVIDAGAEWRCYGEEESGGVQTEPRTTELAAAAVLTGAVTAASRDDLVAILAPIDQAVIDRRARMLETFRRTTPTADDPPGMGRTQLAALRETVESALGSQELPVLDDIAVVMVADALRNTQVRDAFLVQPDDEHYQGAERLMTVLVRTTAGRDRAEAASLLALYAYRRGDTVLAGIALENGRQADPQHRFTRLLRELLDSTFEPHRLIATFESASREAGERLAR